MDKINFLLWYRSSKIGEMASKIIDFEKKSVSYIENLINKDGGIGGVPINIDFVDIKHTQAGRDEAAVEHYLSTVNSKEYTFIRGPGAFGGISKFKKEIIENIKSNETIIFNDSNSFPTLDADEYNVIDIRSNVYTDPEKTYAFKAKTYLKLLEKKGRVFFVANFSTASKYWDEEEELKKDQIYLFNIDKEAHKDQKILQRDINNFFKSQDINKLDLIHLGGVPNELKQNIINSIQNYNQDLLIITRPVGVGESYIDYQKILHPITLIEDSNFDIYLSMESLIEKVGIDMSIQEKQVCNQRFIQFEIPLLIKNIMNRDKIEFSSRKELVNKVIAGINKTDGKRDIYMGISKDLLFKDNKNNLKNGALVELALPSKESSNVIKTLHRNQISIIDQIEKISSVIAFNIDVERITNVSIEDGIFGAEFYLDITSKNEDPIDSIKFNNLSSLNPKHEVRRLEHIQNSGAYSARYIVTSNFDFNPIADNYPFDEQFIYIAISGVDAGSQIQPVPEQYVDSEFKIDGWSLIYSKSGINRKKNWVSLNRSLNKNPKISEEIRLGWELKRENSMTLLKVGIPLFFLYILLYYTLFVPIDQIESAFNNINLAFLSSIALYFSVERPQPLKMTTIDVVFAFFYIMAGMSLIAIVLAEFFPNYYELLIYPLRILLPASIVALGVFIKRRLNLRKYKPSITK